MIFPLYGTRITQITRILADYKYKIRANPPNPRHQCSNIWIASPQAARNDGKIELRLQ
jgi:hypothetical protein